MTDFTNKTVLIAGGNGLIGSAIVRAFQATDASVFVSNGDMSKLYNVHDAIGITRPDIFINATYPKDWIDHIKCFETCTLLAAEDMAKRGGGSIINLSSIYGLVSPDFRSYKGTDMGDITTHARYSMVKGGIIAMTRTVAVAYADKGVRANCIAPGGVFDNQQESFVSCYKWRTPMGRMATPKDITGAVLWLCGDGASYVTGQCVTIDGGLTLL